MKTIFLLHRKKLDNTETEKSPLINSTPQYVHITCA